MSSSAPAKISVAILPIRNRRTVCLRCLVVAPVSLCVCARAKFQCRAGHGGDNASICQRSLDIPFQASSRDRLQTCAIPWQQRADMK